MRIQFSKFVVKFVSPHPATRTHTRPYWSFIRICCVFVLAMLPDRVEKPKDRRIAWCYSVFLALLLIAYVSLTLMSVFTRRKHPLTRSFVEEGVWQFPNILLTGPIGTYSYCIEDLEVVNVTGGDRQFHFEQTPLRKSSFNSSAFLSETVTVYHHRECKLLCFHFSFFSQYFV